MFQIVDNKVFMDPVHGYISVPKCFVNRIIDTEMFQRLRNIDQTGMRVLYPDAKHDRFGHSLGVYHLGCKAVDSLLDNFSKDAYWAIQSDNKSVLFWAKNKLLFMLACLLHDIGHVPFSHSLEMDVIYNSISGTDNIQFMKELAELIVKMEHDSSENVGAYAITAASHEQIGARYILEYFRENIEAVYDDLIKAGYPNMEEQGLLYAEHYDGRIVLNKDSLDEDICFIARMILGLKYSDYRPEKQIRNCFIELLNSNNFDVDKLDYILRDTQMSGISNVNVDVERLISSISIVTKTVYKNKTDFIEKLTNATIYELNTRIKDKIDENSLAPKNKIPYDNGIHLTGKLKGTIKLFPGTHVKIYKDSKFGSLEDENAKARITVGEPVTYFSEYTEVYQDGEKIKENNGSIPLNNANQKKFYCVIKNAYIQEKNFVFDVHDMPIDLQLDGYCEIKIVGTCNLKGVLTVTDTVAIEGTFNNLVLLGNNLQSSIPNENAYNEFNVGYKKQAMNIIANVLEARDYLYLWVYAHHKVIYYANYLIPILSRDAFAKRHSKKKKWKLSYKDIIFLDDYYVWTEIKKKSLEKKNEEKELYNELLSRKYKYSVYKSLAEFDLVFQNFSDDNKRNIQSYFKDNIDPDKFCLDDNERKKIAGYLKKDFVTELQDFATEYGLESVKHIKDIVFVETTYKAKPINPHNTLIIMGDRAIAMEEIPLLRDRCSLTPKKTSYYFYLYYTTIDEEISEMVQMVTEEMKTLLQLYFGVKYL